MVVVAGFTWALSEMQRCDSHIQATFFAHLTLQCELLQNPVDQ